MAAGQVDGPGDEKVKREVKKEMTQINRQMDREATEASLKREDSSQDPVVKKEEPVVKMEVDGF